MLILSVAVGDAPRSTIHHASSVTNPSSIRGASGTAVSSSNALILLLTVTRDGVVTATDLFVG
jgi:hypothetical protein